MKLTNLYGKLMIPLGLLFSTIDVHAQDSFEMLGKHLSSASQHADGQSELYYTDLAGLADFAKEQNKKGASSFEVNVKLSSEHQWNMVLSPSHVLVKQVAGVDQFGNEIDLETNITYQGYLKGDPTVNVRMTISDELVHAFIMDGNNSYVVESSQYNTEALTVSKVDDTNNNGHAACGIPEHANLPGHEHEADGQTPKLPGFVPSELLSSDITDLTSNTEGVDTTIAEITENIGIVRWAVVCDVECQDFRGSQAGVNADLQTIVNVVNGYYAQYNARYELQPIIYISGTSNPWTNFPRNQSAHTNSFQSWASQNISVEHNVGMLFTGVDQQGISFAFLGHMCTFDDFRYGMHAYSFELSLQQKANIVTHELGHLWGANHIDPPDRAYIMNFQIFDGTLDWKDTTQTVINNARLQFDGCLGGGGPVDSYCPIQIGLGAAGTDWINSVAVNGSIIGQDNARALPRGNNTSTIINTSRGESAQLTVNLNNNFDQTVVAVYADWNQDNDFNDPGEVVASQRANQPSFNFNIIPPNNAVSGNTRLRIRLTFDGNDEYGVNGENLPACGQTTFDGGEVEDYTINVAGGGGVQTPNAPSSLSASAASDSQISVSWSDNSNNETSFELQRALGNGVFSTITTLNNNTTNFSDSGLQPRTLYRYRVRAANSAGSSTFSNTGSATTTDGTPPPPPQYCASTGGDSFEFISRIEIGNFINDSADDSFTPYTDFTSQTIPLSLGDNSATLTPGYRANRSDLEAWVAWIDFNGDGDFDDTNERVTAPINGRGSVNTTISIPSSAAGVTTRMRVSMRFSQEAAGPCANFAAGEVEDYTVTISNGSGNQAPTAEAGGAYSGAVNQNVTFNSNGSFDSDGNIVSYNWDFGDGNSSALTNPTHAYSVAGTYTVTLTVTDNLGGQATDTASVNISPAGGSAVPDACATSGVVTGGRLTPGEAACLNDQSLIWLSLADVSGQNSVVITIGNGTGNFDMEYNNGSWPNADNSNNSDAVSTNAGNSECIYVTNNPEFWGYIKVTGGGTGASIIVDYNTAGCRQ